MSTPFVSRVGEIKAINMEINDDYCLVYWLDGPNNSRIEKIFKADPRWEALTTDTDLNYTNYLLDTAVQSLRLYKAKQAGFEEGSKQTSLTKNSHEHYGIIEQYFRDMSLVRFVKTNGRDWRMMSENEPAMFFEDYEYWLSHKKHADVTLQWLKGANVCLMQGNRSPIDIEPAETFVPKHIVSRTLQRTPFFDGSVDIMIRRTTHNARLYMYSDGSVSIDEIIAGRKLVKSETIEWERE